MSDEFTNFSTTCDLQHLTSSPGKSKANGKAEFGVKIAKCTLKKSIRAGTNPYLVIVNYRNTSMQGMITSPAQRLMSQRTKDSPSYNSEPTTAQDYKPGK